MQCTCIRIVNEAQIRLNIEMELHHAHILCTCHEYQMHCGCGPNNHGLVYGAEYEAASGEPIHNSGLHDHNVPCTVCRVTQRYSVLMIPGQYTCPTGWTREYYGYLVTAHHGNHRTMYECMDISPETVQGLHHAHILCTCHGYQMHCGLALRASRNISCVATHTCTLYASSKVVFFQR